MFHKRSFPAWAAPGAGALAGFCFALPTLLSGTVDSFLNSAIFSAIGFIAGCVIWGIDLLETKTAEAAAPNATVSMLLLVGVPFVFWIPFFGLIWASVAIYRAHWLSLPDWLSFILVCLFFLAIGISLVTVLVFAMDVAGVV